ncbi:endonuclease MutS2 [Allocoleopsis franciscana]|uniref:Endonuclease MutS2 n=1 Tax=Allocoleopsis franciscana PCC 7113 TaxID=1173027 RepID=K9WAB5_9CYAN|nr:endonuclease MutS2 [Allocoleopsis franciscana]AFZ16756.1 MutS2 family protein [Allocoleopsis franciscana PCC 7113]
MIQSETLQLLEWSRLCQHLATFAATKLGAIAAHHLQPPATLSESLDLLTQTKEVYQLEARLTSGLSFEGIQDIGESLERAELQGLLSGEELLAIATTLSGVRRLRRVIDDQEDVPILNELVAEVRTYPELEQEIHHSIDERGDVADRASPKLAGIRLKLKSLRDRIYQVLQGILQRQGGAVQQQVITQRGDRFVIPVKAPQKDAIPGIVHDTSSTGATVYVEPNAIVGLSNQLRIHRRQEQTEEEAILRALTQQVAAVKPDLEKLLAVATALDLATAKARYSLWLQANPPRFIDRQAGETITLRELRHPLLVWQQQHEQGTPVVPINVQIQPSIRVVAITGPNTGGKTVTLKTLGLAALMAKVGLFVPAREPVELPWFDQVLADIGDEQSIEQSLSTFSGHIRRISRILEAIRGESEALQVDTLLAPRQNSDEDAAQVESWEDDAQTSNLLQPSTPAPSPSLVLLDEVGAGTDPAEGSALAIALLQHLANTAQLTVATTHYGELKALKYQDERFENASVEFDDSTLQPTYRLLWGIPGRSNALAVARRLGLNPNVVDQAQSLIGGASEDINQVIAGLEAQRRRQETKAKEATQLLQQAERLHQEVSDRARLLNERERTLKLSQERAVQEALVQAKEEIAQVIRTLQQGPKSAQNAQKATDALQEIAQRRLPAKLPAKQKPSFRPKVGDRIRIPRLNQTAEVLSAPDEDGELTVRFGLMKMTVLLSDVESLDGQKAEMPVKQKPAPAPTPAVASPPSPVVRTDKNTIDIRGKHVADAEFELEQGISEATQLGTLWIIHGKGTGKLRQGVHAFLERHPLVERFELAQQAEGGTGVTLAYLK